jgi:pyridoxamine 5'-phosphate oxidase-like protein
VSQPSPSRRLHGDEVLADPLVQELLAARLVAVLAVVEPGGAVHAVPMWVCATERDIVLATGSGSRKLRALEHDPRATVVLHDSRAGCEVCGASFQGEVEIVRAPQSRPLIQRVHRHYVTAEGLELREVEAFLGSDDVALRFRPVRALTWDERDSVAARVLAASGEALPLEPTTPRRDATSTFS